MANGLFDRNQPTGGENREGNNQRSSKRLILKKRDDVDIHQEPLPEAQPTAQASERPRIHLTVRTNGAMQQNQTPESEYSEQPLEPAPMPELSIATELAPTPEDVVRMEEQERRIHELEQELNTAKDENRRLREAIDVGEEQLDETLEELRRRVQSKTMEIETLRENLRQADQKIVEIQKLQDTRKDRLQELKRLAELPDGELAAEMTVLLKRFEALHKRVEETMEDMDKDTQQLEDMGESEFVDPEALCQLEEKYAVLREQLLDFQREMCRLSVSATRKGDTRTSDLYKDEMAQPETAKIGDTE